MINVERANLLALKFLANIDTKAEYAYSQARQLMIDYMGGKIATEDDNDTLNAAMGFAFFKGYKLPAGGVVFHSDDWKDFALAIVQHMDYNNYTGNQLLELTKSLIGVDTGDVIGVLLAQRLIKRVPRLINGRYITVYTKTW